MNSELNIMFVANQKYIFPMITLLYSIFTHNNVPTNLYLLYSDIDQNTLSALNNYCNHWENKTLVPVYVDSNSLAGLKTTTQFPVEVYYKLLAIDLLPKTLHKVICIDLDMVVNKSLLPLYNTDITNYPLAACSAIYEYIFGEGSDTHRRLNIDSKYTYFNAGLMLYNLDYLRSQGGSQALIDYAFQINNILKWPEQDVLNLLYIDKYLLLNWNDYNCPPVKFIMKPEDVANGIYSPLQQAEIGGISSFDEYADYTVSICDNATIIHYLGETKPWNEQRPDADTYDIFDRYFLHYSDKALEIFELVNS